MNKSCGHLNGKLLSDENSNISGYVIFTHILVYCLSDLVHYICSFEYYCVISLASPAVPGRKDFTRSDSDNWRTLREEQEDEEEDEKEEEEKEEEEDEKEDEDEDEDEDKKEERG